MLAQRAATANSQFITAPSRGSDSLLSPKQKIRRTMASDHATYLRLPSGSRPSASSKADAAPAYLQSRRKPTRTVSGNKSLMLPGLPRFHPANFPSSQSSLAGTPSSGLNSPEPPTSPRMQQRHLSDAQTQLFTYQRDLLNSVGKGPWASAAKPTSPTLEPLGSPGPVTPFELEGDGYLMAGTHSPSKKNPEYIDKLIRNEVARSKGDLSSRRPTSLGSW